MVSQLCPSPSNIMGFHIPRRRQGATNLNTKALQREAVFIRCRSCEGGRPGATPRDGRGWDRTGRLWRGGVRCLGYRGRPLRDRRRSWNHYITIVPHSVSLCLIPPSTGQTSSDLDPGEVAACTGVEPKFDRKLHHVTGREYRSTREPEVPTISVGANTVLCDLLLSHMMHRIALHFARQVQAHQTNFTAHSPNTRWTKVHTTCRDCQTPSEGTKLHGGSSQTWRPKIDPHHGSPGGD